MSKTGTTTTRDNIEFVTDVYAAFGRGDIPAVIAAYAPDGRLVSHAPESSGLRGTWPASDVGDYFRRLVETLDLTRFDVQQIAADGDTVVALVDVAFTVRATGERHEGEVVQVIRLRDGRTVRFDVYSSEPDSVYTR